jgi:hypothetical protein
MKFFTLLLPALASAAAIDADLLIVGGNESATAAAIQAADLGVRRIAVVNDIAWLGGQFSAEGVGAIDEWTIYRGRRVNFPRSGLFLDVMRLIRQHNGRKYGIPSPGNAFTALDTIEPGDAAEIFRGLLDPYIASGQVSYHHSWQPARALREGNRITGFTFERVGRPKDELTVRARLTIDASDWGDAIRLSGARYAAGADLKSRFNEEDAPASVSGGERNEMNPITYCLVVKEALKPAVIPPPEGYDARNYLGAAGVTAANFRELGFPAKVWLSSGPVFVDTSYPEGMYSGVVSIYTHRRLVDRRHNQLATGSEKVLLNWPVQDYPLYNFPKCVADALERTEAGASKKNIVDMNYAQRSIVFEDAKRYSLGFLHYLQTRAHDAGADYPQSFRYMELTGEFGTPDRMPWKVYIREGLRLEALYMLREQDIKARHNVQSATEQKFGDLGWARVMPPDNVFGFQFNIDFHPTRRAFLNDDPAAPWTIIQTPTRNWSTHTDRGGFPMRGLIPVEVDGLLGAGKNLGYSSIASSAIRLHGQTMMAGQAAATVAYLALREYLQPREVAARWKLVREAQLTLASGRYGRSGVILWPYHDLAPEDRVFVSANMLAVRGILPGYPESLDFQPWRIVTQSELAGVLTRAWRSVESTGEAPRFAVSEADGPATWAILHQRLAAAGWSASEGLKSWDRRLSATSPGLTRSELALHLWAAIKDLPERNPLAPTYLKRGSDIDRDGRPDLEDGLPFDRDNNNVPDLLQ